MSYNILHCSAIDKSQWNLAISKTQADIYGEYEYLQAVTVQNWYGFIWGAYEKVLPFYRKKKWVIIPYVCMPPFCQKFNTDNLTKDELESVLVYLKKNHFLVDYRISDHKGLEGFKEKTNYILNKKNQSVESIVSEYTTLLKKNIAKAQNNLKIESLDLKQALAFLNKNDLFQSLVGKKYQKAFDSISQTIPHIIYAAKKDAEITALILGIRFENKIYLIFPYSNDIGRKYQAMSGLIDFIIQDKEIEIIDFEGSSLDTIARFYEQFNPQKSSYWEWRYRRMSS